MGATYRDPEGHERAIVMGSYGIGVGRLMVAVIETHYDEYGIVWPPALAPFDVHLLTRVTVSRRSLKAGGVELKARWEKERRVVAPESLVEAVRQITADWPC